VTKSRLYRASNRRIIPLREGSDRGTNCDSNGLVYRLRQLLQIIQANAHPRIRWITLNSVFNRPVILSALEITGIRFEAENRISINADERRTRRKRDREISLFSAASLRNFPARDFSFRIAAGERVRSFDHFINFHA